METLDDLYSELVKLILRGHGKNKILIQDPIGGVLWNLDMVEVRTENNEEVVVIT
jgi:hypothetical protein